MFGLWIRFESIRYSGYEPAKSLFKHKYTSDPRNPVLYTPSG